MGWDQGQEEEVDVEVAAEVVVVVVVPVGEVRVKRVVAELVDKVAVDVVDEEELLPPPEITGVLEFVLS